MERVMYVLFCEVLLEIMLDIVKQNRKEDYKKVRRERASLSDSCVLGIDLRNVIIINYREGGVGVDVRDDVHIFFRESKS